MNLFKKKPKVEFMPSVANLRDFRFLGDEAEVLGNRMDHARKRLAESTRPWARNYWSKVVEQLVGQWQRLPALHDSDAKMSIIPRWTVSYDFYERQQEGNLYGISDRAYDKLFRRDADLHASWENHRAERLARAQ